MKFINKTNPNEFLPGGKEFGDPLDPRLMIYVAKLTRAKRIGEEYKGKWAIELIIDGYKRVIIYNFKNKQEASALFANIEKKLLAYQSVVKSEEELFRDIELLTSIFVNHSAGKLRKIIT